MLAYVLALVVGLGSFALYMAAFFFPEVHRKNDFIWSGIGLFYALVLWVCAGRITGGVLLGQTASVSLLVWLGWQTLTLRRQTAPLDQQTALPSAEELKASLSTLSNPETLSKLPSQMGNQLSQLKERAQAAFTSATLPKNQLAVDKTAEQPYVPLTPEDFASARRGDAVVTPTESEKQDAIPAQVIESDDLERDDLWETEAANESTPQPVTPASGTAQGAAAKPASSIAELPAKAMSFAKILVEQVQASIKKLTTKRESKPVYVRKQFRAPDETEPETSPETSKSAGLEPSASTGHPTPDEVEATNAVLQENEADIISEPSTEATFTEDTESSADAILESEIEYEAHHPAPQEAGEVPAVESKLRAVPPKPPTPELVNEAMKDAKEKQVPASPPGFEAPSQEVSDQS